MVDRVVFKIYSHFELIKYTIICHAIASNLQSSRKLLKTILCPQTNWTHCSIQSSFLLQLDQSDVVILLCSLIVWMWDEFPYFKVLGENVVIRRTKIGVSQSNGVR